MARMRRRRQFMARKAARRQAEETGPTPETRAKLRPDPFNVLVQHGVLDTAERDAGLEVRALWYAVTGPLVPRARDFAVIRRAGDGMSDELGEIHAQVYRPWCHDWGRAVADVIDLVVDAQMPADVRRLQLMLRDYARRSRAWRARRRREAERQGVREATAS
jgi:hypothetical protein